MLSNFGVISTIPTSILSHEAVGFHAFSFYFNPMRIPRTFPFLSKTLLFHYFEEEAQRLLPFYFIVFCLFAIQPFKTLYFPIFQIANIFVMKFCQYSAISAGFGVKSFCFFFQYIGVTVSVSFLVLAPNGWRYEIVGDCGLLSCPITKNLMRGRMFA